MKWEKVKLGDIIEIKKGEYITKKEAKEGPYPVILGGQEPAYYIDHFNHTGKAIVVSRSGASAGYVSFWNEPIFVTDGYMIEPKSKVTFEFLFYLMKHVQSYLQGLQGGAAIPHVNPRIITSIDVRIPSVEAQKCISGIISKYDNLIENNQKQIKLLEEATQRLYKEWFVDLRFPGHETTPIVDGVPEGWIVCSIDDLGEYINGYAFKPSDWEESGKPIIKIKELNEGVTKNTPRNSGIDVPEKYYISAGDIVFSWSATLTAMIWDGEEGLLNQHLFKVIPKDGVSREFVLQSILNALNEFKNLTTGATMKHIQRGKLKEVFLLFPKLTIMQKYQRVSEPIRNQILKLRNSNFDLQEARDRLLPKLMNGEIEV